MWKGVIKFRKDLQDHWVQNDWMRWWSGYPLTAGYSNSLFLCKMSVCCCLSLCKATAVWCHTCCLISSQQHLFAGDETPGLPRRGCWVCVVRERLVLMTGNKNTSKTSTKNQAIISTCQQKRKKCFDTSFRESEKRAEQQQEMYHLIVIWRLSVPQLGIFQISQVEISPTRGCSPEL